MEPEQPGVGSRPGRLKVVGALVIPAIFVLGAVADVTNVNTSFLPWSHGGTSGGGGGTSHTGPSPAPSGTLPATPSPTPSVTAPSAPSSTTPGGGGSGGGGGNGSRPGAGSSGATGPRSVSTVGSSRPGHTGSAPTPTHAPTQPARASGRITSPAGSPAVSGDSLTLKGTASGVPASRTLYAVVRDESGHSFVYGVAGDESWTSTVRLGPATITRDLPFTISLMTATPAAEAALHEAWASPDFNVEGMSSLPAGFTELDSIGVTRTS